MDTKLMAAVNKLKEDATAIVELAATSKEPTKEDQSPAANINPLLLASARAGSWQALNVLLEREDAKMPPMVIPTQEFLELLASGSRSAEGRAAARDVEEGVDHQPAASLAAGALLKGVTPDGDTALHAAARSHKGGQHFLKYAGIVYDRERGLLFEKNHNGDTPLHCAAGAGNFEMVSHLIDLAGRDGADRKLKLLRMENNRHETALHEAVRAEDGRILGPMDREALFDADGAPEEDRLRVFVDQQGERSIVKLLMGADPRLADYPADGISPLYLAILLDKSSIAPTLYCKSGGNLSYSGPDGQNALHAALLRHRTTVMIELLVHWKKNLTTLADKDGSTPLHFAASQQIRSTRIPWHRKPNLKSEPLGIVYKANPAALYQADKNGFFPIHVAASVGSRYAMEYFCGECRDSAGLRDAKGRTFHHVAVEKGRPNIVLYACQQPFLDWILNMQDNDGNTALHLALQARNFWMSVTLFWNPRVNLNLTNYHGETLLDVARSNLPCEMAHTFTLSREKQIYDALLSVGGNHGAIRWDKTEEKHSHRPTRKDEEKESDRQLKDATQTLIVASVLIATVAFSATFALPGGYRADDHTNGGTPTLAGSYVFDAFMMATTLAFSCSTLATGGFALAATPMLDLTLRKFIFGPSLISMSCSVTCMAISFALGVYMVLAPVARNTAVAVCVIIPAVLLYPHLEGISGYFHLKKLVLKKGRWRARLIFLRIAVLGLWPFIVIFGWPALASILRHR